MLKNFFAGRPALQGLPQPGIAQAEGEPGQQVQMQAGIGGDDGDQGKDRYSVQRAEIHGSFQETEAHQGRVNMQQDRAARMGDRDAVAHAGGGQLLPREQHVKNKVAFDIGPGR